MEKLAISGGPQVRNTPFPTRALIGYEEKDAVMKLFDQAITTGEPIIYNGKEEEAFCSEFSNYMGWGYTDAVNSGTTAVYAALRALHLQPFTEVVVSPITDAGGTMPIPLMNCIPVIADSAPGKYNTNAEQVEKVITPLTSAILVAHIGGEPLDIEAIVALGKKYNIPIVEDCAQALGARMNGQLVGTFGDIATFSTMFSKHISTGGQGGLVFTRSEELYSRVRQVADRGKPYSLPTGTTNQVASLNFNLDEISAAIGREQLKKLQSIVQRRRAFVADLSERIKNLQVVTIPQQLEGAEASYWFFRLEVDIGKITCDKDTFCRAVLAEGIPISPSYRVLPYEMSWYTNKNVFSSSGYPWNASEYKGDLNREFACPHAIATTNVQFNLAIYENWGQQEIEDIVLAFEKVQQFFMK